MKANTERNQRTENRQELQLQAALKLIKRHISGPELTPALVLDQQNLDLHNAVQLIVTVAREHGLLLR